MLDALFASGELVIAGRVNFHRLYDLPERVLPRTGSRAPVPSKEEAIKTLIVKAVQARGALSEPRSPSTYGRSGTPSSAARRSRVRTSTRSSPRGSSSGLQSTTARRRSSSRPGVELDRPRPNAAVLLSPFDNLLWGYQYATRMLGFTHVIELYKPAPQRRYGYYVLPFLWRDRIVGRADLKSERKDGTLVVKAFHLEPGVRPLESARRGVRAGSRPGPANRRPGARDEGRPLA